MTVDNEGFYKMLMRMRVGPFPLGVWIALAAIFLLVVVAWGGQLYSLMNLAMVMTFRLIGFGWNGGGILLESSSQSRKLISVLTEIEPIPLVVT